MQVTPVMQVTPCYGTISFKSWTFWWLYFWKPKTQM